MKGSPGRSQLRSQRNRNAAGSRSAASKTASGWIPRHVISSQFANPRLPSVPATLNLRLDEYFAAASLMGLLASMGDEPDQNWARDWSFEMGEKMAAESARRRKKR